MPSMFIASALVALMAKKRGHHGCQPCASAGMSVTLECLADDVENRLCALMNQVLAAGAGLYAQLR